MFTLDATKTALVVIDLQEGILPFAGGPHTADDVVSRAARLAEKCRASDIEVTKRQWGAFYGTDLELQLRRRGIDTIILCGISTNIGVESTARNAWELGFNLVIAEDACSAASADQHQGSMTHIFPRIGRVRSTDEILSAL